jgi:hypothetical protein
MRRCRTVIAIALAGIVLMVGAVFAMHFVLTAAAPEQARAPAPVELVAPALVAEAFMVLAATRVRPVGTALASEQLTADDPGVQLVPEEWKGREAARAEEEEAVLAAAGRRPVVSFEHAV